MSVLATILMGAGVGLMVIAAVGLVRLRDPLQRMHSATKAGTLGTTLVVGGVLASGGVASTLTGILVILFLLFTLPIAAQLLGRATYLSGVRLVGIDDEPGNQIPIPELDRVPLASEEQSPSDPVLGDRR